MAIGTSRRNSVAREVAGWGGFFTTVKTAALSTATTLILTGGGGAAFGTAYVTKGMKVNFIGSTEPSKTISAVTFAGGVPGADATLTIPALVGAVAQGAQVVVGYGVDTALLLDSFTSKLNENKWGPMPYSGTRAKYVAFRHGRVEVDGSMNFMLRPSVNAPLIGHAVGNDSTTGTTPTLTSTISAITAPGDISFPSTITAVAGDIVQIGTGVGAECRKVVTNTTGTVTVDFPLAYAHVSGVAISKVVAPFLHNIPSASSVLPSFSFEDFVPYDNRTQAAPTGVTSNAYYIPGAVLKTLKLESQAENGVKVTIDYEAQDKIVIPNYTSLAIPSESVFSFDQEAVLINGTQQLRITETSLEVDNGLLKVFAKNNSSRAFTITAGQQEVKGTFKLYEDQTSHDTFFAALTADTVLAFQWKITDAVTGNYVQFTVPQIVVSEFQDGDFNPGDLIYATMSFEGILDAGASNVNMTCVIQNSDYLSY